MPLHALRVVFAPVVLPAPSLGFAAESGYALAWIVPTDTLFYAGSGIKREWKAFATMKTQHFTTDWRQMMKVTVRFDS
jgi:hypothetical protein